MPQALANPLRSIACSETSDRHESPHSRPSAQDRPASALMGRPIQGPRIFRGRSPGPGLPRPDAGLRWWPPESRAPSALAKRSRPLARPARCSRVRRSRQTRSVDRRIGSIPRGHIAATALARARNHRCRRAATKRAGSRGARRTGGRTDLHDLGIRRHDENQGACGTGRLAAALFPVLQRARRHA